MLDSRLVLLVEDEPLILLTLQSLLEDAGYSVLPANNADEAVLALEESISELLGLITDIRLGSGRDGWSLARHARSLRPDLPVVYVSGDSAHRWVIEGVPSSLMVQKPFLTAEVLTAVSTVVS